MPLFQLPRKLIKEFRQPFGTIVKGEDELAKEIKSQNYQTLVCIGDFSNILLQKIGIVPNISIIDGKNERKKVNKKVIKKIKAPIVLKTKNPPSFVVNNAWNTVKLSFCYTVPVTIFVSGEEDLLFLPACFFAPLNSLIVYGLKDKGGVVTKITPSLKKKIKEYLEMGCKNFERVNEVIAGGTFDKLHLGHKFFLLSGAEKGKKLLVGITSKKYLAQYKPINKNAMPFAQRKSAVNNFLSERGFDFEIFKINDPIGIALQRGQAIVVSKDTQKGAEKINQERKKKGLKPLKIIKIKTILAEDKKEISSQRIKNGEIDKNGRIIKNRAL